MKKRELNLKLHSSKSTTDNETDHNNDDTTEQQMLPCYICRKLYHSGKVNYYIIVSVYECRSA